MDAFRRWIRELQTLYGNRFTNTIKLCNKTKEVVEICELRGLITGENNVFNWITLTADGESHEIGIDPKKYKRSDREGGRIPLLMIFCGGSLLRSPEGDFLLSGDEFFSTLFETVTIDQSNDQNSTGVVNYEVKFQPQHAKAKAEHLKFSRDPDSGWSVECINGRVKLTRKEGKRMTLDPNSSHLPETTLFCMAVMMFWPGAFGEGDLKEIVSAVNVLMVQAKKYNDDRPKGDDQLESAGAEVKKNVDVLNNLCAAKVEWYRPLFPGMENRFPPLAKTMAEVDQEKLKRFATTIEAVLRQPNSLPGSSS